MFKKNLVPILALFIFVGGLFIAVDQIKYKQELRSKATGPPTDFYGTPINFLTVFGQPNYKEASEDTVVRNKIYHASGVIVDRSVTPNRIYVVDSGNNRVLGFASLGYCQNDQSIKCTNDLDCPGSSCFIDGKKSADLIFGQPDENSAACNHDNNLGINKNPTPDSLCFLHYPEITNIAEYGMRTNIDVDKEGNLYVVDVHNNRVLKYSQPFSSDESNGKGDTIPDFVWGQDDLNLGKINKGMGGNSRNASSLYTSIGGFDWVAARGVSVDPEGNIWVADTFNMRVLRFPPNSKQADLVLGQKDFYSTTPEVHHLGPKAAPLDRMCTPTLARVHPETGELYVIDEYPGGFRARILVFNPPYSNGMTASKVIFPKQDGPLEGWPDYHFQATGLTFNTSKQSEYAQGKIWVSELSANRVILIDDDGNIIKVIGPPDKYHQGCNFGYYGQCKGPHGTTFTNWLCAPGSSVGFDNAGNIYLADEHFHRITRYSLPYNIDANNCVPNANGGLFAGQATANSIGPYKFVGTVGTFVFNDQLILHDRERFLVWDNYLQKPTGARADSVIGQNSEYERVGNEFQLGARAFFSVDDKNRLWTSNGHGKIIIFQLPLHKGDNFLANFVDLYWVDTQEKINYAGWSVAFDKLDKKIWINDEVNARLLRISNYDNFRDKLYVDMIIGQPNKESTCCNQTSKQNGECRWDWIAQTPPKPDTLCAPHQIEFDNYGNLYVVDNNYECHGNNRIIVFMAEDLKNAQGMFPNIEAKKVFVRKSLTEQASCNSGMINEPFSPVTVAFNSKNQMIIGNDGYYANREERHLKQLWFYNDPLKKNPDSAFVQGQKPDAYIKIPMGAAGGINFDNQDDLIIQDHTWSRAWLINLDKDPSWLAFLDGVPPSPTSGGPTSTPVPTVTPGGPTQTPTPTVTPGGPTLTPTNTPTPSTTPGGPTNTPTPSVTPGGPTVTPTRVPSPTITSPAGPSSTPKPTPAHPCSEKAKNGDYDCNGKVDETDFTQWLKDFLGDQTILSFFEYWRRAFYK